MLRTHWIVAGALLVGIGLGERAVANGRPPAVMTIRFRDGHAQQVIVGTTFGPLLSADGGATFRWLSENAVGYAGAYDPDYEYLANGTILATTYDGLMRSSDGCTFTRTALANDPAAPAKSWFVSATAVASDGTIYAADSGAHSEGRIYKSTDGAATFSSVMVGQNADYFTDVLVAPGQPSHIWAAAVRQLSMQPRQLLLFRSTDAGQTYAPISVAGFAPTSESSDLQLAGISAADPNRVFVRVTYIDNDISDELYRTTDGGQTWTKVLATPDVAMAISLTGDEVLVVTPAGSYRSTEGGAEDSFTKLTTTTPLRCLVKTPSGAYWACGQNYAPDLMGLATSTDGVAWTKQLRIEEIVGPVACTPGSIQATMGIKEQWCGLRAQLLIPGGAEFCTGASDAGTDAPNVPVPGPKGCCDAGGGAAPLGGALVVLLGLWRRRRVAN